MESQLNRNPELVVALDIGTTKVSAVAGRKNMFGKIEILGYGSVLSEGVIRGTVSNIDKTAKAISDAIDLAEKTSNQEIQAVHVGIAGQHIRSIMHQGVMYRNDSSALITQEDVDKLVQDMYKIALPPGDQILHVVPQEFSVDDENNILDPIGMSGSRLQSNFHVITGNLVASNHILRCLELASITPASITLGALATASSILSKEEKREGVVLVDIGGGTTDVTIYHEGIIRFTSVIPLGGNVITKDIRTGCSVTIEDAEKLKVKFGSAIANEIIDNRFITFQGLVGRERKEISEKNLAKIIQARVEEIFDRVMWEIHRSGFETQVMAGIVLTGGGALLKNIDYLAEYHTGLAARIGQPTGFQASHMEEKVATPLYGAALGLLCEGIKKTAALIPEKKSNYNKVFDVVEPDKLEEEEELMEDTSPEGKTWFASALDSTFNNIKGFFANNPDQPF